MSIWKLLGLDITSANNLLLCREARDAGAYAQAFWLCARCSAALAAMPEVDHHSIASCNAMRACMQIALHAKHCCRAASTPETAAQKQLSTRLNGVIDSILINIPGAHGAGLAQVCAAQAMAASVAAAHEETVQRMLTALTACCADFQAAYYTQVYDMQAIYVQACFTYPQEKHFAVTYYWQQ